MNSTQQSWIAVRLITTFGFTAGADGVAAGVDAPRRDAWAARDTCPELAWARAECAGPESTTR